MDYQRNANNISKSIDWLTVILYVVMLALGWVSIYAASYDPDNQSLMALSSRPVKHLIWIGSSTILIFLILMFDKNIFETFAYFVYGAVILLLIATIFIAPEVKGSHSWLRITSDIQFQPAEFAKFATALALAKFMNTYNFNLLTVRNFLAAMLIIMLPMLCIVLQRETGSALVFLVFAFVFFREGMSGYVLLTSLCALLYFIIDLKYEDVMWNNTPADELIISGIIIAIICIILRFTFKERTLSLWFLGITVVTAVVTYIFAQNYVFNMTYVSVSLVAFFAIYLILNSVFKLVRRYALLGLFALVSLGFMFSVDYFFSNVLEPHQQQRIRVSLGLEDDPSGAGYNVNQSLIAIGSGGFDGKGFLNGTQTKLKYVPEQDTDFIFCTIGEEFGFVGSFIVLLLYGVFILRLIALAERQDYTFGRVYGYCVALIFFFHAAVNVGMVCGITPVIGIPLPFFSYGGSSLWGFTILLFCFLRIDSGRKERQS